MICASPSCVRLVVRHVERHWCASILSTDITGEPAFRFAHAPPPPAAIAPSVRIGDMRVSTVALGAFAFGGDRETGGHLGPEMARLHAGVWGPQDDADTFATVWTALDRGVNFFDTAEMYGAGYSEEVRVLHRTRSRKSSRRQPWWHSPHWHSWHSPR